MSETELKERVARLEEQMTTLNKISQRILLALEGSPLEGKEGLVHRVTAAQEEIKKLGNEKKIILLLIMGSGGMGVGLTKMVSLLN